MAIFRLPILKNLCITKEKMAILMNDNINSGGVVANRGEDLRFPISSSSGFSSPFPFFFEALLQRSEGACRANLQVFFIFYFIEFVFVLH